MSITRHGYVINKDTISLDKLKSVKEELYISPTLPEEFSKDLQPYPIYHENEKNIILPRYYGIQKFGKAPIKIKSEKANFKFTGALRPHQQDIVDTVYEKLKLKNGGLLSLPCGAGKTVISLYLAQKLGLKTLVLVHKSFLQDQWTARASQFTTAKLGLIRQSVIDIENKDIVIAMIQSVSMKDYDPSIFDGFGLVIVDECHHIASRVFSRALYKTGSLYTLGLSATYKRNDGLTKIIYWYLGKLLYEEERKQDNNVIVRRLNLMLDDPLFTEKTLWVKGKTVPALPRMITNLSRIKRRNQILIDTIDVLRKNPRRKILILSGRIAHLEMMKSIIDTRIQEDITSGKILAGECKTAYYIGKLNQDERKEAEETGDILFASYEMAQEGLDIDRLNTIILATPKKSVVQAIGRIMRKILDKTDIKPLIVDLTDYLSVFQNQGEVRYKLYSKNDYKIREFMINNENQVSLTSFNKNNHKIIKNDNVKLQKIFDADELDKNMETEKRENVVKMIKQTFDECMLD